MTALPDTVSSFSYKLTWYSYLLLLLVVSSDIVVFTVERNEIARCLAIIKSISIGSAVSTHNFVQVTF